MANHTIVSPPNDANQENAAPSADPLANVRSTAREALAAHIDRSAKGSGKRSRGPKSSDAEKVESLLCFLDGAEISFALVDDAKRYLSFISNVGNSKRTPTKLRGECKAFVSARCMRSMDDPGFKD